MKMVSCYCVTVCSADEVESVPQYSNREVVSHTKSQHRFNFNYNPMHVAQCLATIWKLLCGVAWCGVVWCGVVWCGVVWCSVVWCGVVCVWVCVCVCVCVCMCVCVYFTSINYIRRPLYHLAYF